MRLDKYLANAGAGTRSQVKQWIRKGLVKINGQVATKADTSIQESTDTILLDNQPVVLMKNQYYMLHKPAGVLSATEDKHQQTVLDLLDISQKKDLFPVGRLDKDTEGLLLITDDGDLAHNLLSPKKHVPKVYYAKVKGPITQEHVQAFAQGLPIDHNFTALPAKLEILSCGETSEVQIEIQEGKFHQIKRMFLAIDSEVLYLKRLSMGSLVLDPNLELGEYRTLTNQELMELKK